MCNTKIELAPSSKYMKKYPSLFNTQKSASKEKDTHQGTKPACILILNLYPLLNLKRLRYSNKVTEATLIWKGPLSDGGNWTWEIIKNTSFQL